MSPHESLRMDTPLVLVVDDEETSLDLLVDILSENGYRVEAATSGKEAIASVANCHPDLILLDVMMPDMSGYEVCRHIKKDASSAKIPVIFVSGLNEPLNKVKGFETGGIDYLTKPIHLEEFLARVKTHIRLYRLTLRFENRHEEVKQLVARRTKALERTSIALRQRESSFRNIFDNSPVSLWDIDFSKVRDIVKKIEPEPSEGWRAYLEKHPDVSKRSFEKIKIRDINQATLNLFEADSKAQFKERLGGIVTPALYQAFNRILTAFVEGKSSLETDASIKTLTGANRDVILSAQRILLDDSQKLSRVLVSVVDISRRKKAEEALRESESRYRLVMQASPDPIVVYDMQGNVLYINPAFTRVFGWTYEALAGGKIDYVPPSAWPTTKAMLERLKRGEGKLGVETQRCNKDGQILDISMSFAVWQDRSGKPAGSVVILRDITEEKKMQKQLRQAQKMESIGTLAGGIAHDFNNILSAIIGYAELSKGKAGDNEKLRRYLSNIVQSGGRAKDLVQQILAFSRTADLGKSVIRITPIIKEALKLLRATIPTSIEIYAHLHAKHDRILGNGTQIHQIFVNLCANASFAMRQGNGMIEILLKDIVLAEKVNVGHFQLVPGDYLKMTVRDTGCGIPAAIIDNIFDPYFTTKSKKEGTGMGLSIVHGIVKDHAGAIYVDSQVGVGTRFDIYLPVSKKDGMPENAIEPTIYKGSGNILLVDDEENLVEAYGDMLRSLGYQVAGETDSRKALELFRGAPHQFDLVLTDYAMPAMTGMQLARLILALRADIPVLLISGYADNITVQQVKEVGLRDLIQKPCNKSRLSEIVHHCLGLPE